MLIVKVIACCVVWSCASSTNAVKEYTPAAEAVPEIKPSEESVTPEGNDPEYKL